MAGHSHWANIKHKKARVDAKRGKIWGKCAKAIMVAAKNGGDPAANLALRYAIEEAKAVNMPRDTIQRAIKKGSGELGGRSFEEIRYEGYGPGGVAVISDALTDNRTRTVGVVRTAFTKHGGNLGESGSVGFMFDKKGVVVIEEEETSEDQLMELTLDAGAEDVELDDGVWTVVTAPEDFLGVKEAIDSAGIEISSAEVTMIPNTMSLVSDEKVGTMVRRIDVLEESDDIQKVYTNMDASAEAIEKAMS